MNTSGFQLSALPTAPTLPQNIGKVDVKGIYDSVVDGLKTGEALRTLPAQQEATDEALRADTAKSRLLAAQSTENLRTVAPLATQQIAEAGYKTALSSPEMAQSEVGKTLSTNTVARQEAEAKSQRHPAEILYGPAAKTSTTVTRNEDGTISTTTKTEHSGGAGTGGQTTAETKTPGISVQPVGGTLPGSNIPVGNLVVSTAPTGQQTVTHIVPPISALAGLNVQTRYQKIGPKLDPSSGQIVGDEWQKMVRNAAGGESPEGAPVTIAQGVDPNNPAAQSNAAPQNPVLGADTRAAIEEAVKERQGMFVKQSELVNISNAAENYIGDGIATGRYVGPLRIAMGDTKAQEFVGSVTNALNAALAPLRGTGRVSNTEFQQALTALPTITDTADTIRSKLRYLRVLNDWALARQEAYLDALNRTNNRWKAQKEAEQRVPMPEIPKYDNAPSATHETPKDVLDRAKNYSIPATKPNA